MHTFDSLPTYEPMRPRTTRRFRRWATYPRK